MKKNLLDLLICPRCLPQEFPLHEVTREVSRNDIVEGVLRCGHCSAQYSIREGIAFLEPYPSSHEYRSNNRYETPQVVSSYLWSHFADLLEDPDAAQAYLAWADRMTPHTGLSLDAGAAVGRFTFEMARKCDFAIGFDNAVAFIRTARELMTRRTATLELIEEGRLKSRVPLSFPEHWKTDNCEFIVADALALPFRTGLFDSVSSLNIVDKVPDPLTHLQEINRVARPQSAQCLFSDPFSWSADVAPPSQWLGGTEEGEFAGRGHDNVMALLEGRLGKLSPTWQVQDHGKIRWKIRTHSNHYESIRSCYVKAIR